VCFCVCFSSPVMGYEPKSTNTIPTYKKYQKVKLTAIITPADSWGGGRPN